MTPPPQPTPTSTSPAAPAGVGGGFGSSLGLSLAVHGAVVVTLALSLRPWAAPSDERQGRNVVAHLEAYEEQAVTTPVEETEPVAAAEEDTTIPVDEFDLPSDTSEEWAPVDPAPATKAGTSLLGTIAFPRVRPLRPTETTEPIAPPDPVVQPEPAELEAVEPRSEQQDSSPQPVVGACPPPAFPRTAERRGWTGTVVLLIDVAADGSVTAVRIESSSGHTILDDAAVRAVKLWRFAPAQTAGAPTAATVRKPIRFGAR